MCFVCPVLTEAVEIGGRQVYQFKTPTKARQMVQKGKSATNQVQAKGADR